MRTRFIHAADIHLGYEQYNLVERSDDFARAYLQVVEHAVRVRPEFVLLAGDLFHKSSADAWMMKQAIHGLSRLREAGIPVVAVEGNHDAQHARKHLSWMEFLCDEQQLILLNLQVAPNGLKSLLPWDPETRRGSWIDIGGTRIYGIKYYGAMTGRLLDEVRDGIEPGPHGYTILMMHAGMDGQVPHVHGGLTMGELNPLHPPVDYLALGHIHKRLEWENWIYNPGSTEINSMEEIDWPHGFFDVEVDTAEPLKHTVRAIEIEHRPFRRISINAERVETLEGFVALGDETIAAARDIPPDAVIELHLGGVAPFKRQEVPVERLKGAIQMRFSPLTVRVRDNLAREGLVTIRHGERMKRADLERAVLEQLIYANGEYRDRTSTWTRLVLDVKNMAADKDLPASIVDHVRRVLHDLEDERVLDEAVLPHNPHVDASPPDDAPILEAGNTSVRNDPMPAHPGGEPVLPDERRLHDDGVTVPYDMDVSEGGEAPCLAPLFEDW